MIPIKHILHENGVKEIFKLIIPFGNSAGTYEIEKPDGWDEVDSKINIDEELFFVKDFIIGSSEKIRFMQYNHKLAFDLLKAVYKELGSDGLVHFKWIAVKEGVEYDLLKDNFDVDLTKYAESYEKSMFKIELEIKKSEAQNKLFTRDETTVDLFSNKDLDDNDIIPVETFDIGYKKGSKVMENYYFATAGQERGNLTNESNKFYVFSRSEEYDLGINGNPQSGVAAENNGSKQAYFGPFIHTDITLKSVKLSISNFDIGIYTDNVNFFSDVYIYLIITLNGNVQNIQIPSSKAIDSTWIWDGSTYKGGVIRFSNLEISLEKAVEAGSTIDIWFVSPSNTKFKTILLKEEASITITSNLESPIVKTKGVRLFNGINQIVKNYTESKLFLESAVIGEGGIYYNTSISTGIYLRGLPAIYLSQKMKTSLKKLLNDGAAKLLAMGFDVLGNKVIIEDLNYFFKDYKVYDLTQKLYLNDDYKIENDKDVVHNSLLFGSKKYSTNTKDDIRNFVTSSEFSTPIISVKNKLDKQTDFIIDEYKIQELIEDKTSSTNNNDDDLVLIDMVNVVDFWDTGVFDNCNHAAVGGYLMLTCFTTPFDTTLISVGEILEITEGINIGTHQVISISGAKIVLNKTTGIQEGVRDTPIRYKIPSLTKNRTNDGFTNDANIRNFETSTNVRHNPKYQMARWFGWFGSGLRKKRGDELVKVTNYKNNSEAQMKCNSQDLMNELQDLVIVGADENLGRLRSYSQALFNGDQVSIAYTNVSFQEFISIYESWRYGLENDRFKSRGYLSINTPDGIYDVFPFGEGAFSHNKKTNVLTIKAKIKGKSVSNPTLISIEQITKDSIELNWDFSDDYINPKTIVQYSLDGINWVFLKEIPNLKTDIIQSDLLTEIMTGEIVYFRALVSAIDFYNKISNTLQTSWKFNDWTIKEISRSESVECGTSYLSIEIKGTVDFDVEWFFSCLPGGGYARAINFLDNTEIVKFEQDYSLYEHLETKYSTVNLINQSKIISILLKNSDKNESGQQLNCINGNDSEFVASNLEIKFKNSSDQTEKSFFLNCETIKRFRNKPNPLDPNIPNPV